MRSALDNITLFQNHDNVRVLDRGEPVSDDKYGPAKHEPVHTLLDNGLGPGIDGGGGLIQDHDRWVGHGRPGNGDQLALALGQTRTITGKDGVISLWKTSYKAVRIGQLGGGDTFFVSSIKVAITNVFHDGSGKEVDVLQNDTEGTAEISFFDLIDIERL